MFPESKLTFLNGDFSAKLNLWRKKLQKVLTENMLYIYEGTMQQSDKVSE